MINSKVTEEVFDKLYQIPENQICFECNAASSRWASVNNGIFLCLKCSGLHRGLGVNVSSVRSVELDSWNELQLNLMLHGGNQKLRAFFESYQMPKDAPIDFKYKTKISIYYRQMLRAIVDGQAVPDPPNKDEALKLIDFSNPNFMASGVAFQASNQDEDTMAKIKQFFSESYNKTENVVKGAIKKVDDKVHDPDFQKDLTDMKQKVSEKTKQLGEKSSETAKKGITAIKTGFSSAWMFIKTKTNQIQQTEQQQPQKNQQMTLEQPSNQIQIQQQEKKQQSDAQVQKDNAQQNYQEYFEEDQQNSNQNDKKQCLDQKVIQKDDNLLDALEDTYNKQ